MEKLTYRLFRTLATEEGVHPLNLGLLWGSQSRIDAIASIAALSLPHQVEIIRTQLRELIKHYPHWKEPLWFFLKKEGDKSDSATT